jgi:hypothetical protein
MVKKNPILNITSKFIDLVNLFQKKYVEKREVNTDLYIVYQEVDQQVDGLLEKLNNEYNKFKSDLDEIENKLIVINGYKINIDNLNKKMENDDLDNDEYLSIDEEIKILKVKCNEIDLVEKEKEIMKNNIFDIKEIVNFTDNLNLFSNLLYSLVKVYEENIKEEDFDEINADLMKSESTALINMMKIIKYKYYEGMEYDNYFINNFFNIQQFYTLLALSNNSLKFMEYGVDQKNIKKHFNLLKLQNLVLLILGGLCVRNNSQERKFAHYTNLDIGIKLATNMSHVRLNSVDFMNDPSEGKILKDFLNLKYIHDDNIHINTFLTCFTFNHNSLNQFRLYGNTDNIECSGVSLVFESLFFAQGFEKATASRVYYKLPIFRCLYLDYFTGYFEVARRNKFTFYQEYKDKGNAENSWEKYISKIKKIESGIKRYFDEMKVLIEILYKDNDLKVISLINNLVNPLRFLIKHFAFQEEQECRMMRIENIENSEVVFDVSNNKSYIDYKLDANKYLCNIYIGEKCKLNYTYLIKGIAELNGRLPKVRVTDNPFRSEKKDYIYKK